MALNSVFLFKTRAKLTVEMVERFSRRLYQEFDPANFADDSSFSQLETFPIEIIDDIYDETSKILDSSENWARLNTVHRFYSLEHRAGGHPKDILDFTKWLETSFPGVEVWYGNDSDPEAFELVDAAFKQELESAVASKNSIGGLD